MHKVLHPNDDSDKLFDLRKGGRGHTNIEDSVDASIRRLENFIKKSQIEQITGTIKSSNNL